jgi:hypothetical protein
MAFLDSLKANPIIVFLLDHLEIWILLVISLFAIWYFARHFSKKNKPQVISRAALEKTRRLEELKYNSRHIILKKKYKILNEKTGTEIEKEDIFYPEIQRIWHGRKLLGIVTNIYSREENPSKEKFIEIVFRPSVWFDTWANPFSSKKDIIRLNENELEPITNEFQKHLSIKPDVSIDSHMGEYYDAPNEEKHKNWINEQMWKHDKEANSSFYEVESQKRATFDLNTAAQLDLKEKEIQAELARKKGYSESV